jgi:polar amino acid transport system substrate-binding protein
MRNSKLKLFALALAVFAILAAACGDEPTSSGTGSDNSSPAAAQDDLLARIKTDGVLRVATDQKYKPQSWYDTKTSEWQGFDVEVAQEVARRLGVEAEIAHQEWDLVTAGTWNDRWDMNVGSMTVTEERASLFFFSPAYYYTPASIAVNAENTSIQDLTTDLDGKKVCVGSSTTYEAFLEQQLNIPGYSFDYVIDDPEIITFATDTDALDNLALGDGARCDAAMTALPTIDGFVADGGSVKVVGDPLYGEPLAIAFDKSSPIDNASLFAAVTTIIDEMHADGTLTDLSMKWYGEDISQV